MGSEMCIRDREELKEEVKKEIIDDIKEEVSEIVENQGDKVVKKD